MYYPRCSMEYLPTLESFVGLMLVGIHRYSWIFHESSIWVYNGIYIYVYICIYVMYVNMLYMSMYIEATYVYVSYLCIHDVT